MDSGPRPVKQVVITKDKPIVSASDLSEHRIGIAEQSEEEEEDEEKGSDASDEPVLP